MPSRLSTFSFNLLRSAFPWCLAVVLGIELWAGRVLPPEKFSHEVDRLLQRIETRTFDKDILLLGDSVGHNIFSGWKGMPKNAVDLPANQAIELPGQYYLLQRYLARNKPPSTVVFMGHNPMWGRLEQVYTENFVQRCFTRWPEILELAWRKKDPEFGAKMLLYRYLATLKYRLHLQEDIWGRTNAEVYTGLGRPDQVAAAAASAKSWSLWEPVNRWLTGSEKLHEIYMGKICDLMSRAGTHFYYVPAPLPESGFGQNTVEMLQRLKDDLSNCDAITVLNEEQWVYPDADFYDGTHFYPEKREAPRRRFRELLSRLSGPTP